jgi:flagellar biosynthetic protein FliP
MLRNDRPDNPIRWRRLAMLTLLVGVALMPTGSADAQDGVTPEQPAPIDNPLNIPDASKVLEPATDSDGLSATLQLLLLLTVLTLAPAILVMVTCFTRIVVVLALLRQALATQQLPPNQVLIGLALFMTFFIMTPTWQSVHGEALKPYFDGQIDQEVALQRAAAPVRAFMIRQIEAAGNEEDVYMFLEYRGQNDVSQWKDVPTSVMIPAFVISELKVAFVMGFRIYLPFLIIDLVIASVLIRMGMIVLPPVLISLPFKLLLFVLVNGWHLVVGTLLTSFG